MDKKTKGTLLGISGTFLWFTPFTHFQLFGIGNYTSGEHFGNLGYLLLASSVCFALFCLLRQFRFALVAAGLATGLSIYFAVRLGTSIGWGLIGLLVVSLLSVALTINRKNSR